MRSIEHITTKNCVAPIILFNKERRMKKKTLTAKEFEKKYPLLKDHADYKNYGSEKKKPNAFSRWVSEKEREKGDHN